MARLQMAECVKRTDLLRHESELIEHVGLDSRHRWMYADLQPNRGIKMQMILTSAILQAKYIQLMYLCTCKLFIRISLQIIAGHFALKIK